MEPLFANANAQRRSVRTPATASQKISLFISSDNISEGKQAFDTEDPPPTVYKTTISLPSMPRGKGLANVRYRAYLKRYFLNSVWRDSDDPSTSVTANSGTSVSDKIYVTFYVGNLAENIRLLMQDSSRVTGTAYDLVLHRDAAFIGELASFSYYTNKDAFDPALFFENQFTNQSEMFGDDGLFIGEVTAQAMLALERTSAITVSITNNRTDAYRSPFWYNKFLTGVSMYLPPLGRYDVVTNGYTYLEYYKRVLRVDVDSIGGPYYPVTLYTLDNPFHASLYTGSNSISNLTAPVAASVNLLNDSDVEMILHQVCFTNSDSDANSSVLSKFPLPLGTRSANGYINKHVFAKSDYDNYSYSCVPSAATKIADWTETSSADTTPGTYHLPYPNGAYRGEPLRSKTTPLEGHYSPFPYERTLTRDQLLMLDGTIAYDSTAHSSQVLSCQEYLYLNSGNWGTEDKVGERAIQFDLGVQPRYVNKLQIIFPKSQEGWQPTSINATIQRGWESASPDNYSNQYPAYWHCGYQHHTPYAKNDGGVTRYIHTLSQAQPLNGSLGDMALGEHYYSALDSIIDDVHTSVYNALTDPTYKDADTCEVDITSDTTFSTSPNTVNPAYDFKRFEYGPFLRQPSMAVLRLVDGSSGVDITSSYYYPSNINYPWILVCRKDCTPSSSVDEKFKQETLESFLESTSGRKALGGVFSALSETQYSFSVEVPPYSRSNQTTSYGLASSSGTASDAFDKDSTTYWEATGYNSTTGVYEGSASTTSTTYSVPSTSLVTEVVSIAGEWIQVGLPPGATIQASQYTVTPQYIAGYDVSDMALSVSTSGTYSVSDNDIIWSSASNYSSVGVYTGTSAIGGVSGEYIRFTVADSGTAVFGSLVVTVQNVLYVPSGLRLLGSNDGGSSWTSLASATETIATSTTSYTVSVSSTTPYSSFAVVATSISSVIYLSMDYTFTIFSVKYNTSYSVSIPTGYYASIAEVFTTLNTSLSTNSSGLMQVQYSISSGDVVTLTSSSFYLPDSTFARLLGFTDFSSTSTHTSMTGSTAHSLYSTVSTRHAQARITLNTNISLRNPLTWYLLTSSNGLDWTTTDVCTLTSWNSSAPVTRSITYPYYYPSGKKYARFFRLVVSKTIASTSTRIADLSLFALDIETRNLPAFSRRDYDTLTERASTYSSYYEWFLHHFHVYLARSDLITLKEYLVKEEYYFAPFYSQTDKTSYYSTPDNVDGNFTSYRPKYSDTPQKMVDPLFSRGRYVGIAPGYMSYSRQYTSGAYHYLDESYRPKSYRDFKCYSWRLCHQLYSFETTGGTISNVASSTDKEVDDSATISKRFEAGMLTGIAVTSQGSQYTHASLGTDEVRLGSDTEVALQGLGDTAVVRTAYNVVNSTSSIGTSVEVDDLTYSHNPPPHTIQTSFVAPRFTVVLEDSDEVSFRDAGSSKTSLRRAADFLITLGTQA